MLTPGVRVQVPPRAPKQKRQFTQVGCRFCFGSLLFSLFSLHSSLNVREFPFLREKIREKREKKLSNPICQLDLVLNTTLPRHGHTPIGGVFSFHLTAFMIFEISQNSAFTIPLVGAAICRLNFYVQSDLNQMKTQPASLRIHSIYISLHNTYKNGGKCLLPATSFIYNDISHCISLHNYQSLLQHSLSVCATGF